MREGGVGGYKKTYIAILYTLAATCLENKTEYFEIPYCTPKQNKRTNIFFLINEGNWISTILFFFYIQPLDKNKIKMGCEGLLEWGLWIPGVKYARLFGTTWAEHEKHTIYKEEKLDFCARLLPVFWKKKMKTHKRRTRMLIFIKQNRHQFSQHILALLL